MEKFFPSLPISREHILGTASIYETLIQLEEAGFLLYGPEFTLKSGVKSRVYVNGRNDLTEHPAALRGLGSILARVVWDLFTPSPLLDRMPCPIGIPMAGTAMTTAAALDGRWGDFPHRLMRPFTKTHGAHKSYVDGKVTPNLHDYSTIDNVVTDGGTKFETAEILRNEGYPIGEMQNIIAVDRQQGGIKRLNDGGLKTTVVFNLLDLTFVFGELKVWPKDAVKRVEDEIAAHQFT
jgi:orotate phosphoribosyltransferase